MATSPVISESLAAVRRRPLMYLGAEPLVGMALEAIENCLDEHRRGRASKISIDLAHGWLTVADDGDGISIERSRSGASFLELVFTTMEGREPSTRLLGARATRDEPAKADKPGGLGLGVVSSLCERLEVESQRDGQIHRAVFSRGVVAAPLELVGKTQATGLKLRLLPDSRIFETLPVRATFDRDELRSAIQRIAYISPQVSWDFCGQDLSKPDGLVASLVDAAGGPLAPGSIGLFERTIDQTEIAFAVGLRERKRKPAAPFGSWANGRFTPKGGVHVDALRAGLEDAFGVIFGNSGRESLEPFTWWSESPCSRDRAGRGS